MIFIYLFIQLISFSIIIESSLRGYLTKYDCSNADINPIRAISKIDLRKFIKYAKNEFNLPILNELSNDHKII